MGFLLLKGNGLFQYALNPVPGQMKEPEKKAALKKIKKRVNIFYFSVSALIKKEWMLSLQQQGLISNMKKWRMEP